MHSQKRARFIFLVSIRWRTLTLKHACIGVHACAHAGAQDVSNEMKKILDELEEEGVSGKVIIKLHIKNPNVPCLDLIDMPGLVTAGNVVRFCLCFGYCVTS